MIFQSTLPVWGATICHGVMSVEDGISIHAPRVGSDLRGSPSKVTLPRFQSTLPVWGATPVRQRQNHTHVFQSTLPVWGATQRVALQGHITPISIHAPRVGSDAPPDRPAGASGHFNPRSPCGERHYQQVSGGARWRNFNPRSPCGERRRVVSQIFDQTQYFNPRSPCGERRGRF